MDSYEMDYTTRTRLAPNLDPELMKQVQLRMMELGHHKNHHLHMGPLTWLFTNRGWVMISKKDHGKSAVYPPDKTIQDVIGELEDW